MITIKKMKPLAIAALTSATLFGCASSDDMNNTTAMDDEITMSETQTMAGKDADAVVVETEIVAPIVTIPVATLSLENTVEIDEMFDNIEETEDYNLVGLAQTSPNLSTFVQLLDAAGLSDDLKRDGEFTVFAPTNEAFAKLSQDELEMLLLPENRSKLIEVLSVHVLPSKVASNLFNTTQRIELSDDRYIPIHTQLNGTQIVVGGANILLPNVEASNGYIHVVDNVVLPSKYAVEDKF